MRLQTKVLIFLISIFLVLGLSILLLTKRVIHTVLINEIGKRGYLKTEDLPLSTTLGFETADEHAIIPVLQKGLDRTGGVYAITMNREGRVLAHTNLLEKHKFPLESVIRQISGSDEPSYRQITLEGRTLLDVSLPVWAIRHTNAGEEFLLIGGKVQTERQLLGTFHIGLPLEELFANEKEISDQVIMIIILSGVSALVVSLLSIRKILKRIRRLAEGTERISRGEYGTVIPAMSGDELGELAQSFNRMSERLARRDELILSSAGEGIIGLNLEGKATFVNPAAARMLGYLVEELIGRSMHELLHFAQPDRTAHQIKECPFYTAINYGTTHHVTDEILRRKDGTSFPAEYVSTPLREKEKAEGAVVVIKDITERRAQAEVLEYRATHDILTNLPNRTLLTHHLSQELARAGWHKRVVAVLFLDLDNFKKVNDTLGHDLGDLLLKEVAERLTDSVRDGDMVARLGGDEFVVVLADIAKEEDITQIAQKVLLALSKPFELTGRELYITTSIGVSLYPNDGENVDMLLKNADTAMYRAKEQGKNHFEIFSAAMNARFTDRLALETDLHRAIERGEFLLHYQPQFNLKTGQIVGMEALVRWKRSGSKIINPAEFIPLAEETGLIIPIGEWVLRTALMQNKAWQELGLPPIRIAVNLSARQFQQKNLLKTINQALNESGSDPRLLELELTESILMQNETKTIEMLCQLNETGVKISIDDFGTGFSSLSYLQRFPISALKIDRSFIQDIPTDPNNSAIVTSIITLGHSMKLKVIAEGVETVEQLEFLRSIECDEMQGYLYSIPLTAEDATNLLVETRGAVANYSNRKKGV